MATQWPILPPAHNPAQRSNPRPAVAPALRDGVRSARVQDEELDVHVAVRGIENRAGCRFNGNGNGNRGDSGTPLSVAREPAEMVGS